MHTSSSSSSALTSSGTTASGTSALLAAADSGDENGQALGQLYQEICDQKDVIMACLEEDKCDIEQVVLRFYSTK